MAGAGCCGHGWGRHESVGNETRLYPVVAVQASSFGHGGLCLARLGHGDPSRNAWVSPLDGRAERMTTGLRYSRLARGGLHIQVNQVRGARDVCGNCGAQFGS